MGIMRWSKVSGILSLTIILLFASTLSSAFSDEEVPLQLKNNQQDDDKFSSAVDASDNRSSYSKLLEKTKSEGKVRVIVELAIDFQPEGKFSALKDKMNQREKILDIQERLLEKMQKYKPELLHKFKFIPFLALNVDRNSLEQLESSSLVTSIQEDIPEPAILSDSTGIVGANPEAFNLGYSGAGQAVVILDTGVEKSHDFLSGKVVSEACYSTTTQGGGSKSFSVCPGGAQSSTAVNSGLPCSIDGCYHGTHVAGIASGNAGISGAPTSGVAKDSKIIPIQVFSRFTKGSDCGGSPPCMLSWTSDQISALERVLELHNDPNFTYDISSVNLSLGGGAYTSESACDSDNVARKMAVDNLRSVGIATIASSGNSHFANAMGAPACISTVVSVGATTKLPETVPTFSNSASFLDLLATGVSIRSSLTGNSYGELTGTSMAAPHVTGAWAILKQFDNQATVDEVLTALKNSGIPINDPGSGITTPRIQIDQALEPKFLEIKGDPVASGFTTYQIVVTGQIFLGPNVNSGDILSPDGTTLNGGMNPTGLDDYFFTGDIVSITAGKHIFSFVDGVEVPNDSQVGKYLEIKGDPVTSGFTTYQIVVTGQIFLGPNVNSGDILTPDGTTLDGGMMPTGLDDYFFTGDIVSITAGKHIFSFVDGVEVPNDSSPS